MTSEHFFSPINVIYFSQELIIVAPNGREFLLELYYTEAEQGADFIIGEGNIIDKPMNVIFSGVPKESGVNVISRGESL